MKKILVVDDTKNIRTLLTKCLQLEGYDVKTAENGGQALEILQKEKFDLIFLDIKMPLLSGTEVIKKMRGMGIHTPVIVITAYGTIKNAVETTNLGAIAYLQKPFTADKIRLMLNELNNKIVDDNKDEEFKSINYYMENGENEKAIKLLEKLISKESLNPKVYLLLSKAYEALGKKDETESYLKLYSAIKN